MASKTLAEVLGKLILRRRLNRPIRRRVTIPSTARRTDVPLTFLAGYKTYIVAAAMLIVGLAQLTGVDLPSFEDQSAGQLMMEALAIIFLRKGMKSA